MICTDGLSGILTDQLIAATAIALTIADARDRLVRTAGRGAGTMTAAGEVGASRSGDIPGRGGDEIHPRSISTRPAPPRGTLGGSS
jgi:hypothetical protein